MKRKGKTIKTTLQPFFPFLFVKFIETEAREISKEIQRFPFSQENRLATWVTTGSCVSITEFLHGAALSSSIPLSPTTTGNPSSEKFQEEGSCLSQLIRNLISFL